MAQLYTSVGLTALPYSGKTAVGSVFASELGFVVVAHSSLIRNEAERRGALLPLGREDYMRTYLTMIDESGRYVLAEMALRRAEEKRSEGAAGIVFDGIRTIDEMACYRASFPGFFGLGIIVDSDIETSRRIRFERMKASQRTDVAMMSWAEFMERDEIEWGENHPFYSVKKCLEMCDGKLLNNGSEPDLEAVTRTLIAAQFKQSG